MDFVIFKELNQKEQELNKEYANLSRSILELNGGAFSYKTQEADDEDTDFEDRYPVQLTVYGHKGTYEIGLTSVYLQVPEGETEPQIIVDGIDRLNDELRSGFTIYPQDFHEVCRFLLLPVSYEIDSYARQLATMALVEKYEKMPHDIIDENDNVTTQYHTEFYEQFRKQVTRIEKIIADSFVAEQTGEKDDVHSAIMEMADEISTLELIQSQSKPEEEMMFEENNCFSWKEEFQDEFNSIYDEVEGQLNELFQHEID